MKHPCLHREAGSRLGSRRSLTREALRHWLPRLRSDAPNAQCGAPIKFTRCRKMAYEFKPIHAHQREIVRELFVNTADDSYIAARWCFVERLNVDFFWLAVHALEK